MVKFVNHKFLFRIGRISAVAMRMRVRRNRKENQEMKREWEQVCVRCGRCCYEKIEFEGEIYFTDEPCEYLDPDTRLCRIYPERYRIRPGCVALAPQLVISGLLPDDCPYIDFVLKDMAKEEGTAKR